ncbi:ubiquitin ligase-binding protein bul1 [Yamadazyma tenuis]|uniref:Uncharacterized protein n=1 Tax=Candida tenuis (strain ATCC 10573 / BCRC 21748 / CBS 615 / JCM 9827 / NBRC 10315 / NRRL Y-1498 / VKM Y-70) TaxID=590646 RepID=G3BCI3_CANTC|nr:uncharacterized protein CANTEDRAFT_111009 [Yamadazyma tenuis ATCC 10573]XP_006689384.1 uncharacterized protein CANTEDRAFT_111009 [Yamadazyma tenuis ATCC 10573]EGV60169.1 hypothetical protein CANTEDRAFT_111009 [Yamadazyma tenuis ATCC 10573]EGV60170.1 hypothetical protein CANTEDRAFT_111009 [Yamadazyma tenuis ATCC 10573]WEJ94592.1 ubiquitin ligase-binding protein bul1 [Yamadazyma tenuis]
MRFNTRRSSRSEHDDDLHSSNTNNNLGTPSEDPPSYDLSMSSSSSTSTGPPPISSQSSSSILRGTSLLSLNEKPKKKKNVPYRPAPEQQSHIDKLGSSNVTSISTVSSNTHTEYFDVLPSFQMFQSILKRDDEQFNENLSILPPEYGDTRNTSPSPPNLSPMSSASSTPGTEQHETIDGMLRPETSQEQEYNFEENYGFGEDEADDGLQNSNREYYSRNNITNANNTYGHTVLDNIDRLPKLNTSPIDIQVFLTKGVPEPHMQNELETRLKEYTNGDLVNGYIVIHNTSSKPVSFGLFTVSLEGTTKAVEKKTNSDHHNSFSKVLMKKFLKMYDLNASYGYTDVPNSAGIEYKPGSRDLYDDCILGLPNERILVPGQKYKKFFTFKFPNRLLDTTCSSSILPHILSPPSVGVDSTSFNGKASHIELNKALGYGFIPDRGTPLLTRDHGFHDMSVSYTIEAKFIDKVNSSQEVPVSHNEINESDNMKDYVVSRGAQYFLRFIPDLKELISYFNEDIIFGNETFGSVGIDGKLFNNYIYTKTWRELNSLNSLIEQEIDARLEREQLSDDDIKHKNLIIDNYNNTNIRQTSIVAKEQQLQSQQVDEEAYYCEKRMIGSRYPVDVFSKKKKKILSSLVKVGHSKMYVQVPDQPVTYESPKLIKRYNLTDDYSLKSNELVPVNSISSNRINELYRRIEDDYAKDVKVSVVFEGLDSGCTPPPIANIDCNIVAWSFKADYPLPCEFEYDFFYESLHPSTKKVDQVEITKQNLQQVKDQTANYIHFLKANKTFISKNSYLYLKSMKTLGIKRDTITEFFSPISETSHPEIFADNWKLTGTNKWTKDLRIPLDILNKHNIALIPTFQSCLFGRLYCLQVVVKFKGGSGERNEFADNVVTTEVPVLVG